MKKFLFDLFPVILFFVAYKIGSSYADATQAFMSSLGLPLLQKDDPGIYLAVLAGIAATFLQVAWVKLRGQKVEAMLWASLAIIVIFGGATFLLHDASFIKWKPTVLYWLFAIVLVGSAMRGKNLIQSIMSPQMELPDEAWGRLNLSWAGFFAFMGIANLVVAFIIYPGNSTADHAAWVNFKLFGSLILMLIFVVLQSLMLNKYLNKKENN